MSKKLIFASNNPHKLEEIRNALNPIQIFSLSDLNILEEIEENGPTLEANASIKSNYIFKKYKLDCFSDDSGLEIDALNMSPGVHSARYAGNTEANIEKVLKNLKDQENRKAQFRTVISLIKNNQEYFFEGIVKGKISKEKKGVSGFGYDPIFIPDGFDKSFAEMSLTEKNSISHRALAIKKLVEHLKNY